MIDTVTLAKARSEIGRSAPIQEMCRTVSGKRMSAFGGKADMRTKRVNVRF
jgi:hypothetical protein